jgi:pectinesterase
MRWKIIYLVIAIAVTPFVFAGSVMRITVSRDGKSNYRTIQGAINSVKDSGRTAGIVIFIKNGVYSEKDIHRKGQYHIAG